ncbi:MAG: hypothetical protein E4G90_01960 [Gemmatimonadales bacterium]|nr:MAG: hypothetical protein E4G90_01960 [Gemmatimonadales bacterium]
MKRLPMRGDWAFSAPRQRPEAPNPPSPPVPKGEGGGDEDEQTPRERSQLATGDAVTFLDGVGWKLYCAHDDFPIEGDEEVEKAIERVLDLMLARLRKIDG